MLAHDVRLVASLLVPYLDKLADVGSVLLLNRDAYAGAKGTAQNFKASWLVSAASKQCKEKVPGAMERPSQPLPSPVNSAGVPGNAEGIAFLQKMLKAACYRKDLEKLEIILQVLRSKPAKAGTPLNQIGSSSSTGGSTSVASTSSNTFKLAAFILEAEPPLVAVIELLFQHSAVDVNEALDVYPEGAPAWRITPLHAAALSGREDVLKLLLANGADITLCIEAPSPQHPCNVAAPVASTSPSLVSRPHSGKQRSALCQAMQFMANGWQKDPLAEMAAAGAALESAWGIGQTPLHLAAAHGEIACMELLLEAPGADVDVRGSNSAPEILRSTPLTVAALTGQTAAARVLLQHGACMHPSWAVDAGHSPLLCSLKDPTSLPLASLIFDHSDSDPTYGLKANRGKPLPGDWTPLAFACYAGNAAGVEFLLQKGADVRAANAVGKGLLHTTSLSVAGVPALGACIGLLIKAGLPIDNVPCKELRALQEEWARSGGPCGSSSFSDPSSSACAGTCPNSLLKRKQKLAKSRAAAANERVWGGSAAGCSSGSTSTHRQGSTAVSVYEKAVDPGLEGALAELKQQLGTAIKDLNGLVDSIVPNLSETQNPRNHTALACAVVMDQANLVELFLKHGADPNQRSGPSQQPPLMIALEAKRPNVLRIVRVLMSHRASLCFDSPWTRESQKRREKAGLPAAPRLGQVAVNAITEHAGMRMRAPTALMMAVASNMTDVVSELLSLGVDANVPITTCGFSAVHMACTAKSVECLPILLSVPGIQIHTRSKLVGTPLHAACIDGCLPAVQMLLAAGAAKDLTARFKGLTPAMTAAAGKSADAREIVALCMEALMQRVPLEEVSSAPRYVAHGVIQGVVAAATLKQDEEAEALQAAEEASGAATVYAAALQAQARLCHTQPAACIGYATANASLDHSGGPGLLTEGGSSSSAMVHHNAGAHARAPSLAGSSSGGDDGSSSGAGDRHGSSIAVVHGSSRVLVRAGSSGSSLEGVDSDFDFAETAAEDDHWATSLPASIHQDALQGTMQGTMQECMHAVKGAMQGLLEQEAKAIARAGVSFELAAAVAGVSMEEVHAAFRGV